MGPLHWKQHVSASHASVGETESGVEKEVDCQIVRELMTVWPEDSDL